MAEFKLFMKAGNSAPVSRQVPDGQTGEVSLRSWSGSVTVSCKVVDGRDTFLIRVDGDIDTEVEGI